MQTFRPDQELVFRLFVIFVQLKGISHHNLQTFIGVTMNQQNICEYIVSEVCAKGSLTDILDNEIFKLDWSFKNSLIRDIVFVSQLN